MEIGIGFPFFKQQFHLPSPFISSTDWVEGRALGWQVREQVAEALGPAVPADDEAQTQESPFHVPLWTCSGNTRHMWEEISSHLEVEENESGCPKTRESELLLNGPLQGRPPGKDALLDLNPLGIVEFDQLQLR